MGIRFYCPKGHKLHVKNFQAGKKGVCPHCGSRFVIPMESERESSKSRKGPSANGSKSGVGKPDGSDDDHEPVEIQITDDSPEHARGASNSSIQTRPSAKDAIDEQPNAVWYVRPTSGGQYGPARGDVMRKWISEGRVGADSLVWREGWGDWKTAESVLPSIVKATSARSPATPPPSPAVAPVSNPMPASSPVQVTVPATNPVSLGLSAPAANAERPASRARGNQALAIGIVVFLAMVAIGLTIALVYVLRNR